MNKKDKEIIKSLERKISESKQEYLYNAQIFLDGFKKKLAHTKLYYQDDKKEYMLKEFKNELFVSLINMSAFKMLLDEEYFEVFKKELVTLNDTE